MEPPIETSVAMAEINTWACALRTQVHLHQFGFELSKLLRIGINIICVC